jgi:large subunit ribosomal protein L9
VLGQIKSVGKYPVTVRLHPEVTTELDIAVVAG